MVVDISFDGWNPALVDTYLNCSPCFFGGGWWLDCSQPIWAISEEFLPKTVSVKCLLLELWNNIMLPYLSSNCQRQAMRCAKKARAIWREAKYKKNLKRLQGLLAEGRPTQRVLRRSISWRFLAENRRLIVQAPLGFPAMSHSQLELSTIQLEFLPFKVLKQLTLWLITTVCLTQPMANVYVLFVDLHISL